MTEDLFRHDRRTDDKDIRPTPEATFWAIAKIVAERSTCPSGARHGAVLVSAEGRILSVGYGSPASGHPPCDTCWLRKKFLETGVKDWSVCPSIHAEINALANAARVGVSTVGAVLYVTKKPCDRCWDTLHNAGISEFRWEQD